MVRAHYKGIGIPSKTVMALKKANGGCLAEQQRSGIQIDWSVDKELFVAVA